jgi:DNA-binding CsgD family transcriptional regulator
MFDTALQALPPASALRPLLGAALWAGPERRTDGSALTRWLAQTLDEIDYGMLLLGEGSQLLHANQAARAEMDDGHPLQILGRELRARHSRDVAPLHDALAAAAQRNLRRLLTLGQESLRVSVAIVPLGPLAGNGQNATLVLLGKRQMCEQLSVQWFARSHGLTPAEARVLEALCRGTQPNEIAAEHGVGIATVRTQIGSIRAKTGSASIRALVGTVAKLPPMIGLVRSSMPAATMAPWRHPERPHVT